jgi:hypothetical protein
LKRSEGLNYFSFRVLLFKPTALSVCYVVFVGNTRSELLKTDSKKDFLTTADNVLDPVNTRVEKEIASVVLRKICT